MKIFLCASFFVLLSLSVFATEGQKAVVAQAPINFQLTKEFCQKLLVEHRPAKNVMYQAGVDVDGKAVVPADLNAFKVPLPPKIRIPVTIQKQFSIQTQSAGTTTSTGTINSTIAQVTQSTGNNTTVANEAALTAFTATLPGGGATPLGALTLSQLETLSGIISESTTSTGTSTGTGTGTTVSQGTVAQSGTGTLVPSGTLKTPYVDEIPLGFVEYELESGEMTYNGKAFSSKEDRLLRQKCRTILEN